MEMVIQGYFFFSCNHKYFTTLSICIHVRKVCVILMGTPPDLQGEYIVIMELQTLDYTRVHKLKAWPFF